MNKEFTLAGCTVERSTTNTGECQQGGQECVNECPDVSFNLFFFISYLFTKLFGLFSCLFWPGVCQRVPWCELTPSLFIFQNISYFFLGIIRLQRSSLVIKLPNFRTREGRIVVEEEGRPVAPLSQRRSVRPGIHVPGNGYLKGIGRVSLGGVRHRAPRSAYKGNHEW